MLIFVRFYGKIENKMVVGQKAEIRKRVEFYAEKSI